MELRVNPDDLKKTLKILSFATGGPENTMESQVLMQLKGKDLCLFTTDKNRIAYGKIPVISESTEGSFTMDPKRLLSLVSTSGSQTILIRFEDETKSVHVHASENENSYITFTSLDPVSFISFEPQILKAIEVGTVNAGVFLAGLRFIRGYLPTDDKDQKFGRMCITDGVFYASNGTSKIAAFGSTGSAKLDGLVFPKVTLGPIIQLIDIIDPKDVVIKTTSSFIMVFSDENHMFGFLKSSSKSPTFPIKLEEPKLASFEVERALLEKKLSRLALSGDAGFKVTVSGEVLEIATVADRPSVESLPCTRIQGDEPFEFILTFNPFREMVSSFISPKVGIYVDKTRLTLRDSSVLAVAEKDGNESTFNFTAAALTPLSRAA